jgi:hypothetical protein
MVHFDILAFDVAKVLHSLLKQRESGNFSSSASAACRSTPMVGPRVWPRADGPRCGSAQQADELTSLQTTGYDLAVLFLLLF